MTKLTLKNKITGILLCILMLIIYLISLILHQNRVSVLSEINTLFKSTIAQETEIRMKETNSNYSSGYKQPNQSRSITSIQSENKTETVKTNNDSTQLIQSEKVLRVKQTFLLLENPTKISILDSLFQATLIAHGINAKAAFTYTVNKNTQYSNTDSAIYTTSKALPAITAGVKNEIIFQAYAGVPFSCLVSRDKVYFIMLTAAFCLILILLGAIYFSNSLTIIPVESIKEEKKALIKIKENLLFDPEKGILYYNNDVKVSFRNYKLKLFTLLLNSPEHFQTSENLKIALWEHVATTNKLNTTIKRLRTDLEATPNLKIISKDGGYQLLIITI